MDLCLQAALYQKEDIHATVEELMSYAYGEEGEFLLDLFSHVKNCETQTGRSFLPALQPVYQSAPAEWIIDLSERKSSLFLEVLKLQSEKKPVELTGWSGEESEVRSFLQCLPYISQLRFRSPQSESDEWRKRVKSFLLDLCLQAALHQKEDIHTTVQKLMSYAYGEEGDFLLDLFSHVKNCETQTGRSFLPALQPVYQSAPAEWIIDLSERKSSLFLEVLKLQTVKKPVVLTGRSDEESEVRSFLQCLPYVSQLRLHFKKQSEGFQFLVELIVAAAECDAATGQSFTKLLTSVCSYTAFPFDKTHYSYSNTADQSVFLLDLFSRVKNYETQTGRSFLPALQPVYQSAPAVWIIDLSERKSSLFLEVLKLQTEKKPVELTGWSDEESGVRSFLQCLPYISQLRGAELCVQSLCKVMGSRQEAEQVALLLQALDFTVSLGGKLSTSSCRSVGRVLGLSSSSLNLTLNPQSISLRGSRLLFRHISHLHTLRLDGAMMVKMVRALRAVRAPAPVTVEELSLMLNRTQRSEGELSRVLSSLASLLRLWNVQCVNLTEHTMEVQSLTVILCHQGSLTIRLSKETLQQLVVVVYETQEEELTHCFLQKVGGDLTSCSLNWEMIHYFLQFHTVSVDFRKSNIEQQNIRELLSVLDRVQLRRLSSSFVLSIIREIYESGSAHCVSSLLSSAENLINLNSRELDSVHCAALRFTLQHCTAVSLSLLWTSIPEEELESIVPLLNHVSNLSVDRLLLLKLLHCCSVSEGETAAVLLSALQHRLDFSCSSTLDLTAPTNTLTLSTEDCRVVSMAIQGAQTNTELILQDCEMEEAGVEQLFTILHSVRLNCSKALLLQFLSLVRVGTELDCVRHAVALSQALGEEVDLSQTKLDLQSCRSLALVLEHSEGLSELDLSHCQLTDHCLELLLPHLHKTHILDLHNNDITDWGAMNILSLNSNVKTIRLSKETLQQLVVVVYETQEEEFTHCFLQKVGGDLTSCSLNWEMIHYFLQFHTVSVDFRKSNIEQQNIRELLSVLDRVQLRRLSSSFVLSIIREIYESGSAHCVSSLLSSAENLINLNSRELDSVHCAALRFTLQHCTAVSLSLLWTSIPEEELESIVPLLNHVSNLSVDRLLLLKLLHCCSVSEGETAAVLLSALQHRLDFSCSSTLDLTAPTNTLTLSTEDCRVVSMTIQGAQTNTELILQDCEMEEAGVEQLFTILHSVRLNCSKALLLQFLSLVCVGTELDCVRRAVALSQALGEEVDLSQTKLDLQSCRSLALVLEHSEGLSELDLSHCQLTDHCLELLLPHLHKTHILDLHNNDITDWGAMNILSLNSNVKTIRLFNNRITQKKLFMSDRRFEIW
ncbi:uncharacterized protein LOC118817061 [Colossoma macropomum]|uniref:uncharacterized protein LOC118817061 n=1 Tax=Colossoma macropomum TaxID=42526 RepID=UPI001864B2F0|nr:uncharacterized protein LOC118817061 [Colossoma macropomum]